MFEKLPTFWILVGGRALPCTEMEKTAAHCSGYQPHPCSNSEALGLNSNGREKMTSRREFFFNFNFIECRNFFMVVPLIAATSVCRDSRNRSTSSCIQAPGPGGLAFQAVAGIFQDGSTSLSVLCHDLGCGASCPGSFCSWHSSDSLNYPGSSQ